MSMVDLPCLVLIVCLSFCCAKALCLSVIVDVTDYGRLDNRLRRTQQ